MPGVGVGSNQDAEDLLASPELHRLQNCGPGQIDVLTGVTHMRTQLAKVTSAVETVFGGEQERGRQKVLHSTAHINNERMMVGGQAWSLYVQGHSTASTAS